MINKLVFRATVLRVFYHERIHHRRGFSGDYRFCFLIARNFNAGTSTARTQTHTRINEVARNVGWRGGSDRRAWEIVPYRRSAQLAGSIHAPTAVEIVYIFYQDRLPKTA